MKIAITGTPCAGKTTIAKALAKKLGYKYINLNKLAKKENAFIGFDKEMRSRIVDIEKLEKAVKRLRGNVILDGHFSHCFDVDLIIVLRCRPDVLLERLKKRYKRNRKKIKENLDAEILGVITSEVIGKKFFEVDSSKPKEYVIKEILEQLEKRRKKEIIDWIKEGFEPHPKLYFVKSKR
jgi:adenylate kinase